MPIFTGIPAIRLSSSCLAVFIGTYLVLMGGYGWRLASRYLEPVFETGL
jgi:hypothetical protein